MNLPEYMYILNSYTNEHKSCAEFISHVTQLQAIWNILFYKVFVNITFSIQLVVCPLDFSRDQFFAAEYEVKYVLYIPEVTEDFSKYFFRYSRKRLKSNFLVTSRTSVDGK